MSRLSPKIDALKALFARSGNQCAFPGCTQPLMSKQNNFIAQVCHIEAANERGERYNPNSTDEKRRSYENLIILCYPHHVETNDVNEYPVERLRQIKYEHEQLFEKNDFKIDEAELVKLAFKMEEYWNQIERLNKVEHIYAELGLSMSVNGNDRFAKVMRSASDALDNVESLVDTLRSDVLNRLSKHPHSDAAYDLEILSIGLPNWLKRLQIDLVHIEVKYLEEYLKTNSKELVARSRFEELKKVLAEYAQSAIHID